jgi:quinol monooxygenase YgiN
MPDMIARSEFLTLIAAAPASGVANDEMISHVAIFRFSREHLDEAVAAFRAIATATRHQPGNLSYDIFRGIDDEQEFYIVERWASRAALAAHEQSDAFVRYGRGILVRYATLHDTVTARNFDVAKS